MSSSKQERQGAVLLKDLEGSTPSEMHSGVLSQVEEGSNNRPTSHSKMFLMNSRNSFLWVRKEVRRGVVAPVR